MNENSFFYIFIIMFILVVAYLALAYSNDYKEPDE